MSKIDCDAVPGIFLLPEVLHCQQITLEESLTFV